MSSAKKKTIRCSWCRREYQPGDVPEWCSCGHDPATVTFDCADPECVAADAGFGVFDPARGKWVAEIDRQTGKVTYTTDRDAARTFRTPVWAKIWADKTGVVVVPTGSVFDPGAAPSSPAGDQEPQPAGNSVMGPATTAPPSCPGGVFGPAPVGRLF